MSGRFSNVNAILIVGHSGNEKAYHQHHIPCKIETTLYARREKKQNIVLIGNPGTGKTHLSIALGLKARILHEFQQAYRAEFAAQPDSSVEG